MTLTASKGVTFNVRFTYSTFGLAPPSPPSTQTFSPCFLTVSRVASAFILYNAKARSPYFDQILVSAELLGITRCGPNGSLAALQRRKPANRPARTAAASYPTFCKSALLNPALSLRFLTLLSFMASDVETSKDSDMPVKV